MTGAMIGARVLETAQSLQMNEDLGVLQTDKAKGVLLTHRVDAEQSVQTITLSWSSMSLGLARALEQLFESYGCIAAGTRSSFEFTPPGFPAPVQAVMAKPPSITPTNGRASASVTVVTTNTAGAGY